MIRLQSLGPDTPSGVPYTDEEIVLMVRKGKKRGHIAGVGRVVPGKGMRIPPTTPSPCSYAEEIDKLKKKNEKLEKKTKSWMKRSKMMMKIFRSDDRFSQQLREMESQPTEGGPSQVRDSDEDSDDDSDEDSDD